MKNFWKSLKKPIIGLCPMEGVTDFPMRQIQTKIEKPAVIYTEFITVEGFAQAKDRFLPKLKFKENEHPIVVQLVGYTPQLFYEALKKIIPMGFDGIDINMGCPDKSIVRKNAGAALIENYRLSGEIITSCLKAISESKKNLPLSVKTRITKTDLITKKWITHLASFPLSEITIHGRIREQRLAGMVNWERVKIGADIAVDKKIIVLGNGGIKSIKEAKEVCQKYNLDGVLIGQGALGNPWVFKEDYLPTKEEIFKTILRHAKLAWNFYPHDKFYNVLKHFSWYPKNFTNCKELRIKLVQTKNLKEVEKIIRHWKNSKEN